MKLSTTEQLAARLLEHHMGKILHALVKDGQRGGSIGISDLLNAAAKAIDEECGGFEQEEVEWKRSPSMNRVVKEALRLTVVEGYPDGWSHDCNGGLMYNGGTNES